MKPLHQFTNDREGMTAQVHAHVAGYSVTLRDDESGEYVSTAIICRSETVAIQKELSLVGESAINPRDDEVKKTDS